MNFTPIRSATTTPSVVSQSQPKGSIRVTQPIGSTVPPQFNLVFTNSTPLTTSMQGGFALEYPLGWDLATSLGMPPEIFFPSGAGQTSTSASNPIGQQTSASASQPNPQQENALASQLMAQNVSTSQPMGQTTGQLSSQCCISRVWQH